MPLRERGYSGPVAVQADTATAADALAIQTRIQGIAQAISK
jgi:hypothetical protein